MPQKVTQIFQGREGEDDVGYLYPRATACVETSIALTQSMLFRLNAVWQSV